MLCTLNNGLVCFFLWFILCFSVFYKSDFGYFRKSISGKDIIIYVQTEGFGVEEGGLSFVDVKDEVVACCPVSD